MRLLRVLPLLAIGVLAASLPAQASAPGAPRAPRQQVRIDTARARLLYVSDSPSAFGSRGFVRGQVFTREGVLVASVAQEGLLRLRAPRPKQASSDATGG